MYFQDEASDEPLPPPPEDLKPPEEPTRVEQNGTEIVEFTKVCNLGRFDKYQYALLCEKPVCYSHFAPILMSAIGKFFHVIKNFAKVAGKNIFDLSATPHLRRKIHIKPFVS